MARLEYWTLEIAKKIKQYDADAIIEITRDTYENEDAYILVETAKNEIEVAQISHDILSNAMDDGYFIVVLPTKMKKAVGL